MLINGIFACLSSVVLSIVFGLDPQDPSVFAFKLVQRIQNLLCLLDAEDTNRELLLLSVPLRLLSEEESRQLLGGSVLLLIARPEVEHDISAQLLFLFTFLMSAHHDLELRGFNGCRT